MKKLFLIVAVIFSLFLISCGDSDSGDSGNTGADDTANTGSDDDTGDTGNTGSDDDTGNTGNTGSDDDGTGEIVYECVGISIENIALNQEYMTYEGSTSVGDETLEDLFSLQFYKEDLSPQDALTVGTYDLATGLNENYSSCTECTLIYEDLAEDGSGYAKYFYQMEGTLEITEVKEGTMESKGTLTAKVVEVTIDGSTYESTPVAGGACYEIETAFDTICIPDCEDKVCGSDGCGGACGDGCEDNEECSEDGTACNACTVITLGDVTLGDTTDPEYDFWIYDGLFTPAIGSAELPDNLSIQFYAEHEAKSYDLAGTNFADCTECILVFEDVDTEAGVTTRRYFQEKGTLEVTSFEGTSGDVSATLTSLQLREATIDGEYNSTFVPDGKCLILETGTVEVSAE